MKTPPIRYLLGAAVFMLLSSGSAAWCGGPAEIRTWACYYGVEFGHESYGRFDLVALDANHPPLIHDRQGRPVLLGYVSVGEVNVHSPLWPLAKDRSFLVKKNEFWDSWIVDARDPDWQAILFNTAFPAVSGKAFDGFFLDTFDSSLSLAEGGERDRFQGTREALCGTVRRIRKQYPERRIAVNRGLPVLPAIASLIDFVIVECLYSYHAGDEAGYIRVDRQTRETLLKQIYAGLAINPNLTVLTLDYAADNQKDLITEAVSFSRKKGFVPYVSTYKLDKIYFHTLDR